MILSCPSCDVRYFADDATIGDSGRTVKCASCGHSWHVAPPAKEPPLGAHETYRLRLSQRLRKQSRTAAIGAWAITATLFFALGAAAVIYRNDLARIWPQSATAYQRAGLDVNRFGLEFGATTAERTFNGTMPVLTVSGEVLSVAQVVRSAPKVRFGLRDESGREVASVLADVDPVSVPAGATGRFSAVIESPPIEAFDIELSFVPTDGGSSILADGGHVDAAPEPQPEEAAPAIDASEISAPQ